MSFFRTPYAAAMLFPDRRLLLAGLSACFVPAGAARAVPRLGPAQAFSFSALRARAQKSASTPYIAPASGSDLVRTIDFDAVQKIRFRPDLVQQMSGPYPVAFFHLSRYSHQPVVLHLVEKGQARQINYTSDYFDYAGTGLDKSKLGDLGFSGFRFLEQGQPGDWLAFQGASYFRSSGQDSQYGISARGIAVNTAGPGTEEFPRFTEFWLEENGPRITIYALLDGPSITGAYQFDAMRDPDKRVVMDVHCELFCRDAIARLGVAPLTSMYWYGENERRKAADWRPEIHDSDGLALWTGRGERIWRPLVNPPRVQTNAFVDDGPRGFGLMQRDRDFSNYQDDGAHYHKRPGLWVEPKGNWGAGAVELVEIPTEEETMDNIVAYWRPGARVKAGDSLAFDYRLHWQNSEPAYPATIARVVATRLGRGGIPGQSPWPRDTQKFVLDFAGGPLSQMAPRFDIIPSVTASRGRIENPYALKVVGTDRWRAAFDLKLDGNQPVDLRLYLKLGEKALTETWLYQYFPS